MGWSGGRSIVRVCVVSVFASVIAAFGAARTQSGTAVTADPKAGLSLPCEGGECSRVRLKNIKERTYRSLDGDVCSLSDKAERVIWVARGEGLALCGRRTRSSRSPTTGAARSAILVGREAAASTGSTSPS